MSQHQKRIVLYSTQGCHLCEMAYALLVELGINKQVEVIDIALNDTLFERYGITIPVLSIVSVANDEGINSITECHSSELGWPFDINTLKQWLGNNGFNYNS